jgi:hemerythrin-like domain-containing protein
LRATPNEEDMFNKILEKSVTAKARDKMKHEAKKTEEETGKEKVHDFLAPILKKLNL